MPCQSRVRSAARPSFTCLRVSGAVVADDVYSGTKHCNGASVRLFFAREHGKQK